MIFSVFGSLLIYNRILLRGLKTVVAKNRIVKLSIEYKMLSYYSNQSLDSVNLSLIVFIISPGIHQPKMLLASVDHLS
jgi:hypothetical protein